MKTRSIELISELCSITENIKTTVKNEFLSLPEIVLKQKPAAGKWSIEECLEHLNLYGEYYIPLMQKLVSKGSKKGWKDREDFNSGFLGEFFCKSMLEKKGKIIKMNTFKDKDPRVSGVKNDVLGRFITQQQQFLEILMSAAKTDLERIRVPITIARIIRIKLGDALRFNIYHNQRHVNQALRVKDSLARE